MRWGYTARSSDGLALRGICRRISDPDSVRHAWDGLSAKRKGAPIHAICGAALRGLGPREEYFDPAHPRSCARCIDNADTFDRR